MDDDEFLLPAMRDFSQMSIKRLFLFLYDAVIMHRRDYTVEHMKPTNASLLQYPRFQYYSKDGWMER